MSNWYYKKKKLNLEDIPVDAYAFIYLITSKDGKIYVGRKVLNFCRKKKLTKKEKLLPGNARKKYKIECNESNWQQYYGSSDDLQLDIVTFGEKYFKREILLFTFNKTDTSFYELYFQIKYNVMFVDSYNRHLACTKFYKSKITNLLN